MSKILFYPEPETVKIGPAPQHWLGRTQLVGIKAAVSFGFNCYWVYFMISIVNSLLQSVLTMLQSASPW